MSQITPHMTAARRARLFELIRQRDLANRVKPSPMPANPAEAQLFRLQAERSICSGHAEKRAS